MLTRPRRTREYTGPTPHSVAIQERKRSNRPHDFLIQERQKMETQRQIAQDQKTAQDAFDLMNDWQIRTGNIIRTNRIRRKVNEKLFEAELRLEERRNALSALLLREEEEYAKELEVHFRGESLIERQAKMRQRAKELAEKRESERLKIVNEKNEQQWRQECVELRPVLSRRHQDQVCAARKHQIETKAMIAAEKRHEDDLYAALWKQDEQVKAAREVAETAEQLKRNQDTLDILRIQVAAKEAQREAAKRVIEQEAELMSHERELRRREEEFKMNEQSMAQQSYRRELERNRIARLKRELRLKEEEQQLEKKILDEASRALNDEQTFTAELREQRIQYENQYREYIRQLRQEEAERERQLDYHYMEDQRREWELKDEKQRQANEARHALMKRVYEIRDEQIKFKEAERQAEIEESQEERNRILHDVTSFKQSEVHRQNDIAYTNREHQRYLVNQMDELSARQLDEKEKAMREHEADLAKEAAYQQRIKDALKFY